MANRLVLQRLGDAYVSRFLILLLLHDAVLTRHMLWTCHSVFLTVRLSVTSRGSAKTYNERRVIGYELFGQLTNRLAVD